jgi:hypothetical protein
MTRFFKFTFAALVGGTPLVAAPQALAQDPQFPPPLITPLPPGAGPGAAPTEPSTPSAGGSGVRRQMPPIGDPGLFPGDPFPGRGSIGPGQPTGPVGPRRPPGQVGPTECFPPWIGPNPRQECFPPVGRMDPWPEWPVDPWWVAPPRQPAPWLVPPPWQPWPGMGMNPSQFPPGVAPRPWPGMQGPGQPFVTPVPPPWQPQPVPDQGPFRPIP